MRCCVWSKLALVSRLSVNQGQLGSELAKHCDGGGLIVDEDAPLAGRKNFAAQNHVASAGVDAVFFKDGLGTGCGLEDAGNNGLLGAVAHQIRRAFATHQQRQRVHQDGFARAGFAREQVQAGAEAAMA